MLCLALPLVFIAASIAACTAAAPIPTLVPTLALPSATTAPSQTATLPATATVKPTATETATPAPSPTPTPMVLIGAGDIGFCGDEPEHFGDQKTADLIGQLIQQSPNATIFTAGDTVYGGGTMAELKECFQPNWGQYKARIRPAPGNHDYMSGEGSPYFTYFGAAAGDPSKGYYSYDLGDWHIVVLNSNCDNIACGEESAQVRWLREDLQQSGRQCTLAYWHHPLYSSGIAGGSATVLPFWRAVTELGVDVVVNGHDHDYERFAPMDAAGQASPTGTRAFVVGTGGAVLRDWGTVKANSEVRYSFNYGVIQFKLYPGRYEWQFFPTNDQSMTDMGEGSCH